jgi:hypothetical protein
MTKALACVAPGSSPEHGEATDACHYFYFGGSR